MLTLFGLTPFIFIIAQFLSLGIVFILSKIFDKDSTFPQANTSNGKRQPGPGSDTRVFIITFSAITIISYFCPWVNVSAGMGWVKYTSETYSPFQLIDLLVSLKSARSYGEAGSGIAVYLYLYLFHTVLLGIFTIATCLIKNNYAYRWLGSYFFPLFAIIPSLIMLLLALEGNDLGMGIGIIAPHFGLLFSFACIIVWLITIIDIIVHIKKCKWLTLFHLYFPIAFLVTPIILFVGAFILHLISNESVLDESVLGPVGGNDSYLPLIAIIGISVMITAVIQYLLSRLWKKQPVNISQNNMDISTADTSQPEPIADIDEPILPPSIPIEEEQEDELVIKQPVEVNPLPQPTTPTTTSQPRKNYTLFIIIGLGLFLIAGGIIGYITWYAPYKRDKNAPRYYTFSNTTNLRSSQLVSTLTVLQELPYGAELITYTHGPEWSEVKLKIDKQQITGYIASPYILPADDFFRLNNAFGDNESKECIETAKCRLALLDYLKRKQYGSEWQVYTRPASIKPNAVAYPRLFDRNSKFTEFAFIIQNNNTGECRLAIYSFTPNETPVFRYEEDAPQSGYIQNIVAKEVGEGFNIKVNYTK